MDYAFMSLLGGIAISAIGVYGVIKTTEYTMRGAEKISKDITSSLSDKVQKKILEDIDSGRFYY